MKNPSAYCPGLFIPRFIPLIIALVLALGGCARGRSFHRDEARARRAAAEAPRATASVERSRSREEAGPGTARAVQVGRYILFRLHWTRADDMAATLAPILQARYGPGAAVVPHVPSNTLIFR